MTISVKSIPHLSCRGVPAGPPGRIQIQHAALCRNLLTNPLSGWDRIKIDFKRHRFFDRFLYRFFLCFGFILGPKLRPCWPHFPPKWGSAVAGSPLFSWVYLLFRFFGRPGPLLAPSGLDLGGFGPPFCRFLIPTFNIISEFFAYVFQQP